MHLNALLDVDIVAVESQDTVSLLLELAAPAAENARARPPATLEVVLDRSGSMQGEPIEAAKAALEALVMRLDPTDNFGLVVFDDEVEVAVPAGPVLDKEAVCAAIRSVQPGSMTNLSGGLLRGLQEARRVKAGRGATLIVLSDGHANQGMTDPVGLGRIATAGRASGVTLSTIGVGLDYDERVMDAVARAGAGSAHFAEQADAAGAALLGEVDGLLEQVAQAATLTVSPTGAVASVRLFNDLPATVIEGAIMVELGDFHAGEQRKLALAVDVPAMSELGLAQVCKLELAWVEVETLTTHQVAIPVSVNVVPGDEAAGRVPNPTVRTELAFQEAQRAKREAAEALRRGDAEAARRHYESAGVQLSACGAPPEMAAEVAAEAELLDVLADRAVHEDGNRLSKLSLADQHRKNRRRGGA